MSILNHFGKVKTTYVPYSSKYPGTKIYYPAQEYGPNNQPIKNRISYYTVNSTKTQPNVVTVDDQTMSECGSLITLVNDELQHKSQREFILEDFADIIKKITGHFTASIWKTLNTSPLLTISELLWLKVDDVDGHVDHLDKMLIPVIEENKLLQLRINVLETKCLAIGRLEKRFMQVTEENNLLQHRLDALETKCLAIGRLDKLVEENHLLQCKMIYVDGRVDDLETMLIPVFEENQNLQRKMAKTLKDIDNILMPEKLRERDVLYELD
jgi:hypothetical protein